MRSNIPVTVYMISSFCGTEQNELYEQVRISTLT